MIYKIPDSRLEKLEKQCNRINNKGATVIFNIGDKCVIKAENNPKVSVPGHEVEVAGAYIINGWEFVATIEHLDKGNIIRCIDDELESKIPEKYKNCGPECEHCHRIRNRKDTYLVYNLEKNEWKQVGKTCLQEYTGGLDAEVCAQIAAFFIDCEDAYYFEDNFNYGWNSNKELDSLYFKKCAYPLIKQEGYKKDITVDKVLDAMLGRGNYYNGAKEVETATNEEIEKIDKWANSISDNSYGYFRNAKLAWDQQWVEYRDLPLIASFINTYFKNQLEKEKGASTSYVGNVGDKIEINIKSIRTLYTKDNSIYSYYAESSTVYEIVDNKGNTYTCSTTLNLLDAEIISATIKGYKEYRGIKQTILVRPKIIKSKERKQEMSNQDAFKALDKIIDEINK